MKKLAYSFLLCLFFAQPAWGDVSLVVIKGETTGEKKASLIASVVDEAGKPVKNLGKKDFRLKVSNREINDFVVEPVSATDSPLSIILGIDVSGSMKGRPFEETRKAISLFLDQLDRKDLVSLMSFGTGVKFLTEFTTEKHTVRQALESLQPTHMETYLYDAVYEALGMARSKARTSRRAVVLVTDGKDEGSKHNRREALERAQGASIPVFSIGFGKIDKNFLQELANITGGQFLFTPKPEDIIVLYDTVMDNLKNQYLLKFPFSEKPGDYTAWVGVNYGGQRIEATKSFLFTPAGAPVIVTAPAPVAPIVVPPPILPWYEQTQWLVVAGGTGLFAILVLTVLVKLLGARKKGQQRIETLIKGLTRSEECELEFPEDSHTPIEFLKAWSADGGGSEKTLVVSSIPDAFLKVDCLASGMVPLTYKGTGFLDELIVSRKPQEPFNKKKGTIYLWVSKQAISRPTREREGHARIFVTDGENYAVEDLGSTIGTLHQGNEIKGKGPFLLHDGDVVGVGGRSGIRLVYSEGKLGPDSVDFEKTTVVGL